MRWYRFGNHSAWLNSSKSTDPWNASMGFHGTDKPVFCFVYDNDELIAVIDCSEWAWKVVSQADYKQTLMHHLQTELDKIIINDTKSQKNGGRETARLLGPSPPPSTI